MENEQLANLLLAHDRDIEQLLAVFPTLRKELARKIETHLAELSAQERANLSRELNRSVENAKNDLAGHNDELRANLRDFARTTLEAAANELGTTVAGRFAELAAGVERLAAERDRLLAEKLAEVPAIETRLADKVSADVAAAANAAKGELANQLSKQVERAFADLPPPAPAQVVAAPKASFLDWFRGNWDKETAYNAGDIFTFRGSCYVVYKPARGVMPTQQTQKGPDRTYGIVAAAGAPGQNGVGGGGSSLPDQGGNAGKFLTTNGTTASWATLAGGGDLLAANNLSDVASAVTAFNNIKQTATTAASGVVVLAADGGTTASTVVQATDSRLSNARTPSAHAASHAAAGSDPLTLSPSQVGLGSVTNDAQTRAAIVPNTAPAAGQVLVGNAGGTAYAPATVSGDATLASTGALTLGTSGVSAGSYGSATAVAVVTFDAKGRATSASNTTITPAVGSITGLGTGIATALAINTGSAGAPVLFNGAGGTPTSLTLTNAIGLPASSLTAGVLAANVTLGEGAGQIVLDAALSADGTYSGIIEAGTAAATLAFGDLVYFVAASSRWDLTDADAEATAGPVKLGICVQAAASNGSATTILLWGKVRADANFPTLTIGAPVYVSTTTGDIQVAKPTGTDDVVRVIGYGNTADELFFCPSNDYVTLV